MIVQRLYVIVLGRSDIILYFHAEIVWNVLRVIPKISTIGTFNQSKTLALSSQYYVGDLIPWISEKRQLC